jgi:hypothetical protein
LSLILVFFLPESPVFLVNKARFKEAHQVLTKISNWNKTELVFDEAKFARIYAAKSSTAPGAKRLADATDLGCSDLLVTEEI